MQWSPADEVSGHDRQKSYESIRYRGKPVEALYRYDAEVDRWTLTSPNVPPLVMEGDSIEAIERELPDVLELITDTERIHGPAVLPGNWKQDGR